MDNILLATLCLVLASTSQGQVQLEDGEVES